MLNENSINELDADLNQEITQAIINGLNPDDKSVKFFKNIENALEIAYDNYVSRDYYTLFNSSCRETHIDASAGERVKAGSKILVSFFGLGPMLKRTIGKPSVDRLKVTADTYLPEILKLLNLPGGFNNKSFKGHVIRQLYLKLGITDAQGSQDEAKTEAFDKNFYEPIEGSDFNLKTILEELMTGINEMLPKTAQESVVDTDQDSAGNMHEIKDNRFISKTHS